MPGTSPAQPVTANFAVSSYSLVVVSTPGGVIQDGAGHVIPAGAQWVNAGGPVTLTAVPSIGYYFTQWTSQSDPPTAANPLTFAMNGPKSIAGNFSAVAVPVLTWATPANQTFGSALGSTQLNAKSSVPGTFVYLPAAGTVLPVGNGQTLSAVFTPTDTVNYAAASISTAINVVPGTATGIQIITSYLLRRDSGNIVVDITFANAGATAATNFTLTSVKIGTAAGTPAPQVIGTIASGTQAHATVTLPGSAGAAGSASTLTLAGTYTGGTLSSNARITLP
jgi:hypothetical protein